MTAAPAATVEKPKRRRATKSHDASGRAPRGPEAQPVARVQWLPAEALRSNLYNPNRVAPPELRLLKLSILEDGWTQPIVARSSGEIVDGFHRWTLASTDAEVRALTGGLVPVVLLRDEADAGHQVMSTVRHNRARGNHHVLKMADLVRDLIDNQGLSWEDVMQRLGMEHEEVDRLYDRAGMPVRGNSGAGFNKGWKPA